MTSTAFPFLRSSRPARSLGPVELAEAALLGDLGLVLCLVGWFVPLGPVGLAAQGLAAVPFAAVAWRNRMRAAVASAVSATALAFLLAGPFLSISVAGTAVLGGLVGFELRRERRYLVAVGRTATATWALAVAVSLPALAVLPELRRLALVQLETVWAGVAAGLRGVGLAPAARAGDQAVAWGVAHWWVSIPALQMVLVTVLSAATVAVGRAALRRLARAVPPTPAPAGAAGARAGAVDDDRAVAPAPAPVRLRGVGYSYPGAQRPALAGVDLVVPAGSLVAVVGGNGAGKSTLARVIAGMAPTSGVVERPGGVGLGRPGGTAMVFQRPESQVLAARVREDVLWGMGPDAAVDVDGLLDDVGLGGFAERETATLSGGELQRLAIAAALARRPRLLVSDESTAMVDPAGRTEIVALLRRLVDSRGLTVVHVTHDPAEAATADLVVEMAGGRLASVSRGGDWSPPWVGSQFAVPAPVLVSCRGVSGDEPLVELRDVGHVYSPGSPWARRALGGVDLTVSAGEGLLVVGGNGSGKSTLARILAGLLEPTEGTATMAGRPLAASVGRVGLSFQHARLQLLRPTVGEDVRDAAGTAGLDPARALELVGLDPSEFVARRVDELSGGEQRRVALAGLLARRPRVLVLDEPFAGLDTAARAGLGAVLARLRAEEGLALVLVSHDLDLAPALVDRTVHLHHGRIVPAAGAAAPVDCDAAEPLAVGSGASR